MSVENPGSTSEVHGVDEQETQERELPAHLSWRTNKANMPAEKSRECYCEECGLRITLSPDWEREYGHHATHCPHSIRDLDRDGAGGESA